jgi:hypothetical protein
MRLLALSVLSPLWFAGCVIERPPSDPPDEPPPSGPGQDCNRTCFSDEVCARDHFCHAASEVHLVRSEWTIRGQPAAEASCAGAPELYIRYRAPDDSIGYSPIPCRLGIFTIDKLPLSFDRIELGIDAPGGRYGEVIAPIVEGVVRFDLSP